MYCQVRVINELLNDLFGSDFAEEFASECSMLFDYSIGSLTILAAAAKSGSDLFKYVTSIFPCPS